MYLVQLINYKTELQQKTPTAILTNYHCKNSSIQQDRHMYHGIMAVEMFAMIHMCTNDICTHIPVVWCEWLSFAACWRWRALWVRSAGGPHCLYVLDKPKKITRN